MGSDTPHGERSRATPLHRICLATLSIAFLLAYTAGVMTGHIQDTNRIDAVHLGLLAFGGLVVVALLKPNVFQRLQIVQLGDLKLEIREVKTTQDEQTARLNEINLILSILLPENERAHLLNLASGMTKGYKGGQAMRTELRRLRSMALIAMQNGHTVESMRSNMTFDLGDYVGLTNLGSRCVSKIKEVDKADSLDEAERDARALTTG